MLSGICFCTKYQCLVSKLFKIGAYVNNYSNTLSIECRCVVDISERGLLEQKSMFINQHTYFDTILKLNTRAQCTKTSQAKTWYLLH